MGGGVLLLNHNEIIIFQGCPISSRAKGVGGRLHRGWGGIQVAYFEGNLYHL